MTDLASIALYDKAVNRLCASIPMALDLKVISKSKIIQNLLNYQKKKVQKLSGLSSIEDILYILSLIASLLVLIDFLVNLTPISLLDSHIQKFL